MSKTKKALLAAVACSAVLAGAFGLTACKPGNDDNKPKHDHVWGNWTVATKPGDSTTGKATRTCSGEGECTAAASDKEYTLPKLVTDNNLTEGYAKGTDSATCSATGTAQYTYNKDGVEVSFTANTPINATAHSYGTAYVDTDPTGHWQVCEHNSAHTTEKKAHDTNANGACSVCGYDPNHEHAFDTNTWDKDETGHWHPTTCGHDVKTEGFAAHVYGDWTESKPATVTEEGSQTRTCTVEGCGYVDTQSIPKLPQPVTGGEEEAPATITYGRYSVEITSVEREMYPGYSYYEPTTAYFKLESSDEAKAYKIKCEDGSLVYGNEAGYEPMEIEVVVEAGESYTFGITTLSFDIGENFSDTVTFSIAEGVLPAKGSASRPISVTKSGSYGREDVEDEDERIYFRLDHEALGGTNVNFTLGAGVKLYKIIKDNLTDGGEGEEVSAGTPIEVYEWDDAYFYAVCRGGDCFVDFEVVLVEGTKRNPYEAKIGTGEANVNTVSGETWFKLETAGKYIIRPSVENLTVELYMDVTSYDTVGSSYDGSPIVITVTEGNPVYIRGGQNSWDEGTITITGYTDADKGTVASEPIVLTPSDTVTLGSGTRYYTYTATTNGMAAFTFTGANGQGGVYFWNCVGESFGTYGASSGLNKFSVEITAGRTYYFKTVNNGGLTGTFKFAAGEFASHNYVITLTDGDENTALDFNDITVKLYNRADDIETATPVATGTTTNGAVTFENIDGSKNYVLIIDGLPATHAYYDNDMRVDSNIDETTNFAALVYAKKPFSVTIALPEGAEELDMSGVKVTLRNNATGESLPELTTIADGTATVSALDPKYVDRGDLQQAKYTISIEIPETCALYGKYEFVTTDVMLDYEHRTGEVVLAARVTYNLTLTDGTNPLEGLTVTVNGETGTTDGEGKVAITTLAGEYTITIGGGNYVTSTKTSETNYNITVVCQQPNANVTGAFSVSEAPALSTGVTPYTGDWMDMTYAEFTSAEGGTYVITTAGPAFGIHEAYSNGEKVFQNVYDWDTFTSSYVPDGTVVTDFNKGETDMYPNSITVTLQAGQSIVIGTYNDGTITIVKQ